MASEKPYTTGAVARMLNVSGRTVQKWCDSGMLKSYRLPGSLINNGDRRITMAALVAFVEESGMPMPEGLR